MRLEESRRSENVEDRRGMGIPRGVRIGGAGGLGVLLIVVLAIAFGIDPSALLEGESGAPAQVPAPAGDSVGAPTASSDPIRDFVAAVLAETEDVWTDVFQRGGRTYVPPKLVLFTGAVDSACGLAESATGPFYCPLDRKVYLDYSFFRELDSRFGASGDFAEAYVIAHEVGHHVQTLLGVTQRVHELRSRAGRTQANELSVRVELQADCFAGLWANRVHSARRILEQGDIEEGLNAASAVGDDRIQRRTTGYVVPDSFTHGSSIQRASWFRRGFKSGDFKACDTFGVNP